MKLINRRDFLVLPAGVIFKKTNDDRGMMIKGDTLPGGNDFFYYDPMFGAEMLDVGESIEYAIHEIRDGMFEEKDEFLVMRNDEARYLVRWLSENIAN